MKDQRARRAPVPQGALTSTGRPNPPRRRESGPITSTRPPVAPLFHVKPPAGPSGRGKRTPARRPGHGTAVKPGSRGLASSSAHRGTYQEAALRPAERRSRC
jgi:hypothetical protein